MKTLTLSIGAYTSENYYQAVKDAVEILGDEPLAAWMFDQNIAVNIEVNPRVSQRFPNSNSNPIFTAAFTWQLADDVETAVHLKFYPLPTPQNSVGVWRLGSCEQVYAVDSHVDYANWYSIQR